jgi:hypothetical protein
MTGAARTSNCIFPEYQRRVFFPIEPGPRTDLKSQTFPCADRSGCNSAPAVSIYNAFQNIVMTAEVKYKIDVGERIRNPLARRNGLRRIDCEHLVQVGNLE